MKASRSQKWDDDVWGDHRRRFDRANNLRLVTARTLPGWRGVAHHPSLGARCWPPQFPRAPATLAVFNYLFRRGARGKIVNARRRFDFTRISSPLRYSIHTDFTTEIDFFFRFRFRL